MEEIAKSQTYRVAVDRSKNRLYMAGYGNVISGAANEPFIDATKDAITRLKPGFTCLADFREVQLLTLDNIAAAVQKLMLESRVSKVAAVWGPQLLARMAVKKTGSNVHGPEGSYDNRRREFGSVEEAEAWLDEPIPDAVNNTPASA